MANVSQLDNLDKVLDGRLRERLRELDGVAAYRVAGLLMREFEIVVAPATVAAWSRKIKVEDAGGGGTL